MRRMSEREMIREKKWWEQYHWTTYLQLLHGAAVIWCVWFVVTEPWGLQGTTNALLGGFNLAALFYAGLLRRSAKSNERLIALVDEVHQLNHALIENRVKMHIAGIEPSDDVPPLAPRLH